MNKKLKKNNKKDFVGIKGYWGDGKVIHLNINKLIGLVYLTDELLDKG